MLHLVRSFERSKHRGSILTFVFVLVAFAVILITLAYHFTLGGGRRSKLARVREDMRTVASALENYYIANHAYPATAPLVDFTDGKASLTRQLNFANGGSLTTYQHGPSPASAGTQTNPGIQANAGTQAGGGATATGATSTGAVGGLTSPVAYLPEMVKDVFSPGGKLPFVFLAGNGTWILISPGRNQYYDIDPMKHVNLALMPDEIHRELLPLTYDPTNGSRSFGDIYRLGYW